MLGPGQLARHAALVATLATACAFTAAQGAEQEAERPAARVPVLLELFTSEGCSSCPPADALIERLLADQPVPGVRLIALSQHVDYWNGLGWRDPFSSPAFTERQRAYADRLASGRMYTPQLVVDGRDEFVGSDRAAALQAIGRAADRPKARVTLTLVPGAGAAPRLAVAIDGVPTSTPRLAVSVATVQRRTAVAVTRGENAGRRLGHVSVARALDRIGTIAAGESSFAVTVALAVPPGANADDFDAIVFAQTDPVGPVVAAGIVSLSTPPTD